MRFGEVARRLLGEQCQYASRYVRGVHGNPNLGQELRFRNDDQHYHDIRIHIEDAATFVGRVIDHLTGNPGLREAYLEARNLPTWTEITRIASRPTLQEARDLACLVRGMQAPLNNGRGVSCVRQVAQNLERGDLVAAQAILFNDGDKLRNYPEIETLLETELGNWLDR